RDAAAGPAERERRADDGRVADLLADAHGFIERAGEAPMRDREAEPRHRSAELLAVLRHADGPRVRADQLDAVLLEHTAVVELERDVERRLSTHRRQQRVRPLLLDDALYPFGRDRLDVRGIREIGIRHDRRGIAVDEDDAV